MIHRTRPDRAEIHPGGWGRLPSGLEVTRIPLVDADHDLPGCQPLFARLTYADALIVAEREGARLISPEVLRELGNHGLQLTPYLGTPRAETDIEHSQRHDAEVWRQLGALEWNGLEPVSGAGKHWVAGAPPGRSRLMGWDRDGAGPGKALWQELAVAHNRDHHDDGTTTMLERGDGTADTDPAPPAPADAQPPQQETAGRTIRLTEPRMTGKDVTLIQLAVVATADGVYDPLTDRAVRIWQAARGLVPDGVFGPRSWRAAGYVVTRRRPVDPRAPACVAALRDADARWPGRRRVSDGIMGDASHQRGPSDHNAGNAVDITHDPSNGCDGAELAELAITDERVTYVIWSRRIYNRARAAEGWRIYPGSNAHTHHVHLSVRADARDDAGPWPWAR